MILEGDVNYNNNGPTVNEKPNEERAKMGRAKDLSFALAQYFDSQESVWVKSGFTEVFRKSPPHAAKKNRNKFRLPPRLVSVCRKKEKNY